jgi:hypothetical protein
MYVCLLRNTATVVDWCGVGQVTIDVLPDVVLLEIFDCYVNQAREEDDDEEEDSLRIQAWHTLVHVCRKWRATVFGSPRRLDLQLLCTEITPVKETLAVWPPLPIVIGQYEQPSPINNIIVALEYNDRVCQIDIHVTNSQLEEVLAVMQQPFPALTDLVILSEDPEDEMPAVVSESFLGGSAPRLQHLRLQYVPFPGLPKLLLSATGLVTLTIWGIPHSGYISPEAMVRCLSTLTRIKYLSLGFGSPLSRPVRESRHPHPPTRSALPALTYFEFMGVSEYLEDLVARIDAPLLNTLHISFFHQLIFDTPQLAQFLARTPNIQPPVDTRIVFSNRFVQVILLPTNFVLRINCRQSDWQLSSLAQVCRSSFPQVLVPTGTVERLDICEMKYTPPRWQDDIEDNQWLEVLHSFTAVKDLHVSREFLPRIAPALQELAGQVLPSLQNLFVDDLQSSGPVPGAIEKFVAARQVAGHPIAVSHWDREQDECPDEDH